MVAFTTKFQAKTVLSVLASIMILSACQPDSAQQTTSASAASNAPNKQAASDAQANLPLYRIGIDPSYQPFVNKNKDGEIEGLDVDLLKAIAKREGFRIELQPKQWSGIFSYLDDKSIDIVMGGAVATDERREKWAVSSPYAQVTTVLITKANSPIQNYEDVKDKKVAYTEGGSVERTLKELQKTDTLDKSQNFASSWLRVKSVMTGTSDAAIGTSASFEYYAAQYPDQKLRVIYPKNPKFDDVVFIVNKENKDLLDKLNKGLESLKQDGTLDKLQKQWLGTSKAAG